MKIHEVFAVRGSGEPGVYIIDVELTDTYGERYRCDYVSAPDDSFGLNPVIRKWLEENPTFPVQPYVPPTAEELRGLMPPLARTKFKLALSRAGLKTGNVQGLIDAIEDPDELDEMQIIWDDEQSFNRLDTFVVNVIGAARTPEQIDTIWVAGLAL